MSLARFGNENKSIFTTTNMRKTIKLRSEMTTFGKLLEDFHFQAENFIYIASEKVFRWFGLRKTANNLKLLDILRKF
jgi:hypothetical protein